MVHAVDVRARIVPRTENCLDGCEQLLLRVGGEVGAELFLVLGFELIGELFEVVGGELDVEGDTLLLFHLVDKLFKIFLAYLHDDVGEHLNETAVAVPSPARIAGLLCDDFDNLLVQSEVKNGVHHAGHRSARARTNGNEKRIFLVAELLAGDFFHLVDVLHDFSLNAGIDLLAVLVILRAGFGGNGEALRNGKSQAGHLGEVRALAAQKLAHFSVAFGEEVTILFVCHNVLSPFLYFYGF